MIYRDGEKLDADPIWPLLYQGSASSDGQLLVKMGFWAVVLCAKEFQPSANHFPRMRVVYAPFDDVTKLSEEEIAIAISAAKEVASLVSSGKKTLVTCRMGLNRSGLVCALAIYFMTGSQGDFCLKRVQSKRLGSLLNPGFQELLLQLCN